MTTRSPNDRFDEAFKAWAERAPETSPAEAAREVLDRLEGNPRPTAFDSGRRRLGLRRLAAAAAVALSVGMWLLFSPTSEGPQGPPETGGEARDVEVSRLAQAPLLDEDVVLIWLDSETPLYMTWNPPSADQGDAS